MSLFSSFQTIRLLTNVSLKRTGAVCLFSSKLPPRGLIREVDPETGAVTTKKTTFIPKITLLSGDSISVTTLQEAEKLSKRRNLKLVKIVDFDTRTQRPMYQLLTATEYHAEDFKQRLQRKLSKQQMRREKVLLINSKIAIHDLDTQLKKAVNWIQKMYEVRVIISGSSGSEQSSEKVFTNIEEFIKVRGGSGAKITQKRAKGGEIKFQLVPINSPPENNNL